MNRILLIVGETYDMRQTGLYWTIKHKHSSEIYFVNERSIEKLKLIDVDIDIATTDLDHRHRLRLTAAYDFIAAAVDPRGRRGSYFLQTSAALYVHEILLQTEHGSAFAANQPRKEKQAARPSTVDAETSRTSPSIAELICYFFFVPPVGGIMMLIGCRWRDLTTADIFLGFLVPLYGHVKFWMA